MADLTKALQLINDTKAEFEQVSIEPSKTLSILDERENANASLNLIRTMNSVAQQPQPKTYEDLAKIIKIQAQAPSAYEPMGTAEYLGKKMVGLVEKPIYAIGEGAAAALETGAKMVGLKKIARYFKESKEMWKTPPITEDVNKQFAWLLESAKKKSTMHGMVVEMAEIGVQLGSLLIQMGLLGKVPGVKALDLSTLRGTAPLPQVTKQMGAMFAHGVATTPGSLSDRFQAGVTRMAYNMTPYIANWTGATGWGARLVDTALNTFLTSPSYIKSMKQAKNPMEFIMMAMPQFMTDVVFALNTTGTPMNQRLKAMGQRPVVFGQKLEEKTAFLKGVDKAIGETERPYGEEAPEPTKKQVVDSATAKAKVQKAETTALALVKTPAKRITASALAGVEVRDNKFNIDFVKRLQRPAPFNISYKVGTIGDFLVGNKVRDAYKESLDVSVVVAGSAILKGKKVKLGPKGKYLGVAGRDKEGKPAIIVSNKLSEKETIKVLLHEAAHMQRIVKGRPFGGKYPELAPDEMVKYVMKLKDTSGYGAGIILTKTEVKKRAARAKKAVQEAKIDELVDPINKGRKLSEYQKPLVASESKDIWEKVGYGWGVLHLGNMRPERMFEELDGYSRGPNTEVGYVKINEAANNKIQGITKGTDVLNATLTSLGIMPIIDKFYSQREHIGARMVLTKTEMVDIYMDMQNKKAIKHLTKPKAMNGMGFSKADLVEVKERVEADPQMKGLADWLFKSYAQWYPIVREVYFKDTGEVLPKEPYYSPLRVQKEYIDFEKDNYAQDLFNRYSIDGYIEKGFTQERQAGASQPIKLDAIGNYLFNLNRIEHYVNFALPLKDLKAVMNNPKWRNAVETQKGDIFYKNVKKYYDAVAGTKPSGADEIANKAMGFLRTNAGTAMLGFNILTAMRQPLSAFQATAEIGLPHVLSAIRQIGLDPSGLEKFVYERSKMVKYRRGQFERFMTETEVSLPELLGKPRAPKAVTGRLSIRDRAMGMAIFMDKNTVLCTWKAAYDRVTQTGKTLDGEKIPTKDLEKAACMEADLAVRRTQPMATVKDLPAWHRSSSWLKMFTMFQNQINNNYNYFAHDIIGKTRAGKITPLQAAQRTLFAYVLPAMLLGMISRGGFPRNKKQIAEDMIAFPTSGLFFAGGIINAMVKGYSDYGIPPLQFAPDLVKMVTSKKWATKGKFGVKGLAEVSGIPYNQFARTWKGMQALMAGDTDDWRRLVWSAYSLEKGLPKKVKGGLKVFKRKE